MVKHNKKFLEDDHLFCLLVKHAKNVSTQTTKLCNELYHRWSVPPPVKYLYEIGQSFADPLIVHSLDPSIEKSRTKEIVFVSTFQFELIF